MSRIAESIIVGAAYLAASMLVFVFTSSYFSLFRTNRSRVFRAALPVVAIPITWLLVRFGDDPSWGHLAIGFTAASLANLTGWSAARLHRPLRIRDDSLRGIALAKGLEAMAVVGSILVVLVLAGTPLDSVYLRLGKIGLGLGIGFGGLALFAVLAALQARSMKLPPSLLFRLLPWILLFTFSNAFMEELWFRALFLRPLTSLLGPIAAIVLTAAVFALAHIGATYLSKAERVRFLMILFPLGMVWGACLHLTGSVIASTLFHAGADLMVINGFIAAFRKEESEKKLLEPG